MQSKTPDVKYELVWEGKKYLLKIYLSKSFADLPVISQSYGILLDRRGKVLVVSKDSKVWVLPGGTAISGEAAVETLEREVDEEAAVDIDKRTIQPFYYQTVYIPRGGSWVLESNQVRYFARIKRKKRFLSDPGGNIRHQKYIPQDQVEKYLKWGPAGDFIMEHLPKFL